MKTVTLTDLKTNGSNAIPENEVSYLIVNSQPKSALVPVDLYETYVEAMEELEDLKATLQRLEEEDIPAKKVFAKLLDNKA